MKNLFTICQKNARKSSRFDGKTLQGFFSDNYLHIAGLQSKILVVVWFLELKYKIKLSLRHCWSKDSLFIYKINWYFKFKFKKKKKNRISSALIDFFFWFSKPITTLMWSFQRIPLFWYWLITYRDNRASKTSRFTDQKWHRLVLLCFTIIKK